MLPCSCYNLHFLPVFTQKKLPFLQGLESGAGKLLYQNGNSLDAEFVEGKIQGHGVFRYSRTISCERTTNLQIYMFALPRAFLSKCVC